MAKLDNNLRDFIRNAYPQVEIRKGDIKIPYDV